MTLGRRVAKLEAGAGFGVAPVALWVYEGEHFSMAYLCETREWLPYAEYKQRWPSHPNLKAYTDRRMVDPLGVAWADAPPARSSADA